MTNKEKLNEIDKIIVGELKIHEIPNYDFEEGYLKAFDKVEKMIKDEIINEEESIKRKAVRDWDILRELRFVLLKIQELRRKNNDILP